MNLRTVVWRGLLLLLICSAATAQTYPPSRTPTLQPEEYHENALRRFEIVSLVSLPFTTIHSFLLVRGVAMIQQRQFSPNLSDRHYVAIGLTAVGAAALIGCWDWIHTRGKDTSEPRIPKRPRVPGLEFDSPPETGASLPTSERTLPSPDGVVISLLTARF